MIISRNTRACKKGIDCRGPKNLNPALFFNARLICWIGLRGAEPLLGAASINDLVADGQVSQSVSDQRSQMLPEFLENLRHDS